MFGWHDSPWMWLSMVVFWSLFIAVAYFAVRAMMRATPTQSGPQATEILKERYARGEISSEEYRKGRETLETPRVSATE